MNFSFSRILFKYLCRADAVRKFNRYEKYFSDDAIQTRAKKREAEERQRNETWERKIANSRTTLQMTKEQVENSARLRIQREKEELIEQEVSRRLEIEKEKWLEQEVTRRVKSEKEKWVERQVVERYIENEIALRLDREKTKWIENEIAVQTDIAEFKRKVRREKKNAQQRTSRRERKETPMMTAEQIEWNKKCRKTFAQRLRNENPDLQKEIQNKIEAKKWKERRLKTRSLEFKKEQAEIMKRNEWKTNQQNKEATEWRERRIQNRIAEKQPMQNPTPQSEFPTLDFQTPTNNVTDSAWLPTQSSTIPPQDLQMMRHVNMATLEHATLIDLEPAENETETEEEYEIIELGTPDLHEHMADDLLRAEHSPPEPFDQPEYHNLRCREKMLTDEEMARQLQTDEWLFSFIPDNEH